MLVAKTPTYAVLCQFPLFVALLDHNPPTLQTDGRTDVVLVAKVRHAWGMSNGTSRRACRAKGAL